MRAKHIRLIYNHYRVFSSYFKQVFVIMDLERGMTYLYYEILQRMSSNMKIPNNYVLTNIENAICADRKPKYAICEYLIPKSPVINCLFQ